MATTLDQRAARNLLRRARALLKSLDDLGLNLAASRMSEAVDAIESATASVRGSRALH